MRIVATLLFIVCITTSASAQKARKPAPSSKKSETAKRLTSREIWGRLNTEIQLDSEKKKFKDFIAFVSAKLAAQGKAIPIFFDEIGFASIPENDGSVLDEEVGFRFANRPARALDVLQYVAKQLGKMPRGTILVRAGRVEIVPSVYATKEYMLNQNVEVAFKARPLADALEELSDMTGVSLVIDPRANEKAQMPVTARFNNDVALQDAVRMLTEMAELKMVYLVTGIFITTPERARIMEKELKRAYQIPSAFPQNPMMIPPMMGFPPPFDTPSPLAPPLPPASPFSREKAV